MVKPASFSKLYRRPEHETCRLEYFFGEVFKATAGRFYDRLNPLMLPPHIGRIAGGMNDLFMPRAQFWRWLAAGLLLARAKAPAQEALMNSVATSASPDQRLQQPATDYTYKQGDFRLWVTPALDLQWIDNIQISQSGRQSDFVVRPTLGLVATYPITQENLLNFNVNVGYTKYINHSSLDGFYLQSGSGLGFDVFIKQVDLNLHDRFSYEQDSSQNSQVANTGTYGTFQNTSGLSATWDLTKMVLSAGYDHQLIDTTSSTLNDTDHSSELLFARAGYVINPRLASGLESSASFTTYHQPLLNNNQSYSLGAYADYKPDAYFELQPRAGYVIYQFDGNSQTLQTSDLNSWYADLSVTHYVTDAIRYSIDAGHRVSLGVQSDATAAWYVTPTVTWDLRKDWSVHGSLSYENGQQGTGSSPVAPGNNLVSENYTWETGTVGVSHAITSRIEFAFNYRLTLRSSSVGQRGYTQNELELQLTYHPQ